MKIIVCDDDANILNIFRDIFHSPDYRDRVELTLCSSAGELLAACESGPFDLIFSDIMLGEEDGIRTAASLNARWPGIRVVFITSHLLEYAEEIFSGLQPYGYIGKPVSEARVGYYVQRLEQELSQARRYLTVSARGTPYDLLLSDIRYFESDKRLVHIHCAGDTISVYEKLDNLSRQLDSRFVRCHQSFVVNLEWVSGMDSGSFTVRGGSHEPEERLISISRNHLSDSRRQYFEYKGRSVL